MAALAASLLAIMSWPVLRFCDGIAGLHLGYALWIAAAVILAFALRNQVLPKADLSPSHSPNQASTKFKVPRAGWICLVVVLGATVGWKTYLKELHDNAVAKQMAAVHEVDAKIAQDMEKVLNDELHNLPDSDDIVQKYGKFIDLQEVQFLRPYHAWTIGELLYFSAVARFEKGRLPVRLDITRGQQIAINNLQLRPPALLPGIDGSAAHPEFFVSNIQR
jgi:hypothetical protein